ncbi:MAG: ABC transporter permease [Thermodesulfobacteriota bacterium]
MDYLLDGLLQAFGLILAGDGETYSAVWATLYSSGMAMTVILTLGLPLGFLLGHCRFPGRGAVRTLVDTLLSLPTVVVGLLVYALLTRRGPLGDWELLFTVPGIALGLAILGLPIVVALTAGAVEGLDRRLRPTLLTLGASPGRVLLTTLWEARFSLSLAAVAAFGRVATEVGVAMMVGGNIKWQTRTITTAIALETNKGQFALGMALGVILLGIALAVNLAVAGLKRLAKE